MPQGQPEAADVVVVSRLAEDDWRLLRDVRLAALTDAPEAFGTTLAQESGYPAGYWVTLVRTAGIFVATSDGAPVGLAAGVPRKPRRERGLAAMWVTPSWRGRGAAAMLVAAVADWARARGARRLSLWVPADNARAQRFYARQGFRMAGHSRPFPGHPDRSVLEMVLDIAPAGRRRYRVR
jgi:GNAT superfamily N-acetyltransferase